MKNGALNITKLDEISLDLSRKAKKLEIDDEDDVEETVDFLRK